MSLIIGIDPGSRLTGYGIIEKDGNKLRFVDAGTIRTETQEMPERLKEFSLVLSVSLNFTVLPKLLLNKYLWLKILIQL
jgi:crossover junction endodeoxyribonuclease RuvC